MNKFATLSTAALFSLFLTACDKPAGSTNSATETTQTASISSEQQAVEDFKKIAEWNLAQEQALVGFQADLQQKLASQDPKQIEEALKIFTLKVNEVLASLNRLDIRHPEIILLKAKTRQTLELSNEFIAESAKIMANPEKAAEMQAAMQEKTEQLIQSGNELQQLQADLQQKFGSQ